MDEVSSTLAVVTRRIDDAVADLPVSTLPPAERGPHVLGVQLETGADPGRLAHDLAGQNVYAGVRGRTLRLSPHLHVTDDDVAQLADALRTSLRR